MGVLIVRVCLSLVVVLLAGCASHQLKPGKTPTPPQTAAIQDLADLLKILSEPYPGRTLLALDVDDTLLTSKTFFGSDAWYEWQRTLPAQSPGYVPCKYDVVAMNYEVGTQVPTQDDAAAIVNAIPLDKIIITGRSPAARSGTIRELQMAGYQLPGPLQPGLAGAIYRYQPDPNAPDVTVSYDDGIFMVAGQNKGLLLLDLLRQLQVAYDRIVLVDDGKKNIDDMRDALAAAGIAYSGVQYTRIKKDVDAQRAQEGVDGWKAWQQLLTSVYPERAERMKSGACAYR